MLSNEIGLEQIEMADSSFNEERIVAIALAEHPRVEIAHPELLHQPHAILGILPHASHRLHPVARLPEQSDEGVAAAIFKDVHDLLREEFYRSDMRAEFSEGVNQILMYLDPL